MKPWEMGVGCGEKLPTVSGHVLLGLEEGEPPVARRKNSSKGHQCMVRK